MNKRISLKISLLGIVLALGFTSCLNDDNIANYEYGLIDLNVNRFIEIPADATHTMPIVSLREGVKTFQSEVRLAAENPAEENIVVTLKLEQNPATVRTYVRQLLGYDDDVDDDEILIYPQSDISVPATLTIAKGKRAEPMPIQVNTELLGGEPKFALITIESVSNPAYTISGNFGYLLLELKARSDYEGIYKYEAVSNIGGNNGNVQLVTINLYKVQLRQGLLNAYSNEVFYVIDPVTNTVTAECPSLGAVTESGTYDPATKSFSIKWTNSSGGYTFDEKFTWLSDL